MWASRCLLDQEKIYAASQKEKLVLPVVSIILVNHKLTLSNGNTTQPWFQTKKSDDLENTCLKFLSSALTLMSNLGDVHEIMNMPY